jgi:hypothetical protein
MADDAESLKNSADKEDRADGDGTMTGVAESIYDSSEVGQAG